MKRKAISFVALVAPLFWLQAQQISSTIKGKVTDDLGNPVSNVELFLQKNQGIKTVSNDKGSYELQVPHKKPIKLVIRRDGLAPKVVDVTLSTNENGVTYVDVTLPTDKIGIEEVVITDNRSLVTNTRRALQKKLNEIPGGTELVDLSQLKDKKSQTLKDAIGEVPGVVIQQFFGSNDQPRLNIRGSGIQSNPQSRGVSLLQDGIPINLSDGSYIIGVLEPQAAHLVEVYKGSNALQYGSSYLGGAINFITKNGYNASPLALKVEGGSFDYFNVSASSGFVSGKTDGFISTSYNQSHGFRTYNDSKRFNILTNFGRRFSKNFESRLFINYTDLSFDIPGPLTKAQYEEDPTQVNGKVTPHNIGPNVVRDRPGRASKILRLGSKSVYKLNKNSDIRVTLYYQYVDDVFTFPIPVGVRSNISNDYGIKFLYQNYTDKNHLKIGANWQRGIIDGSFYVNKKGEEAGLFARNDLEASKYVVFINDIYNISDYFKVNAALQLSWDSRGVTPTDLFLQKRPVLNFAKPSINSVPYQPIPKSDFEYTGFNPKIGFIYAPSENISGFINFSRSYEPPTFLEIINLKGGTPNSSATKILISDLDEQTASTLELGTRGSNQAKTWTWDVALYNSWVKNELLALTDINGITGETINSPGKTIHRGVEARLTGELFKGIFVQQDQLKLGISYTFSDFYFAEGQYKGNQIAGVPKHYILADLNYESPFGLFVNFNVESLPEKTPIDHNNDLYQDPYTLLNARIGYHQKRWGIYLDARNLTDKVYASSYLIREKAIQPPMPGATINSPTSYIPGVGRNFTVGFTYTF